MSFEFTVLSDECFIEIHEAWADSPWRKTVEQGFALRDRFGWVPSTEELASFMSDVRPHDFCSCFTDRNGIS